MKNWLKIILGVITIILLGIIVDLICIFTINKPLFAVQARTPYTYTGIFYNTYNCPEYPMPQIKSKKTKFSCAIPLGKVINIVDTTKEIKDFACAEALEQFYEDNEYTYYYNCIKSKYMIVKYESGYEETITESLKKGKINISDLDKYKIDYIKYEK